MFLGKLLSHEPLATAIQGHTLYRNSFVLAARPRHQRELCASNPQEARQLFQQGKIRGSFDGRRGDGNLERALLDTQNSGSGGAGLDADGDVEHPILLADY